MIWKNGQVSSERTLQKLFSSSEDDLLEQARLLREEAQSLETELRETPRAFTPDKITAPTIVTELNDSTWTFTYRFSSQPKDDNDESPSRNYSGKCTILLKGDGYSELVTTTSNGEDADLIQIAKVWGWDEEYSQEDQQQYVLFSMDVQLPSSDPKLPGQKERYYWQARIDRSTESGIQLADGTITVKKDVSEKTNGMWGLFQVAGILTQFRYVGDFAARPQ